MKKLSPLGALPLLIYVEGVAYTTSPIRIRITSGVLVLLPLWENIPYAFHLKPAHHNTSRPSMNRLLGHRVLSPFDPPAGSPMSHLARPGHQ